jgi:hypothetical protein
VETPLTILYTGGLRGDLELLPRLFTFIRQLKAAETGRILLIDAGEACIPIVWHCDGTGGRSMLVALDSMGYDAVYAQLSEADRAKLSSRAKVAVVDQAHPAHFDGISVSARRDPNARLTVLLPMGVKTILEGDVLRLARLEAGEVGRIRLSAAQPDSSFQLTSEVLTLQPQTPPDSTISSMIHLIKAEAQLFSEIINEGRRRRED